VGDGQPPGCHRQRGATDECLRSSDLGWNIDEYILLPIARFTFTDPATWQQGLFFLVGLAMAVLALHVNAGGWHSLLRTAHLA